MPTYSLTVNNRNKRAEYSEDLHAESVQVNKQVCRLNSEFEELNRPLGFNTLKFDADLVKSRPGSSKISYNLLHDGLHPGLLLSKKWLQKLQIDIVKVTYCHFSTDSVPLIDKQEEISFNPFPNDKYFTLPNSKLWQRTILDLMKMAANSPNR